MEKPNTELKHNRNNSVVNHRASGLIFICKGTILKNCLIWRFHFRFELLMLARNYRWPVVELERQKDDDKDRKEI